MHHQCAFTTTTSTHYDKYIALINFKIQISLDDEIAVSHSHFFYRNASLSHFTYIPSWLKIIVMSESEITMKIIPVTTADVAASPTAEALRPHCIPLIQPE